MQKQSKISVYLTYANILGTFIVIILLLISSGSASSLFKYYEIVFPLNMPFFSTMFFNVVYIYNKYTHKNLGPLIKVFHLLNRFNVVCFIIQFIALFGFECWKIRNSVEFYYGHLGNSKKSIEYINNIFEGKEPSHQLYLRAIFSCISLVAIYACLLTNCWMLYLWISSTNVLKSSSE